MSDSISMQKLIELLTKELSTTEEDKESLYSLLQKEYLQTMIIIQNQPYFHQLDMVM